MPSLNELRDGDREWGRFFGRLAQKEISRRRVMKGGAALAALASSGSLAALLGACSEDTSNGTTAAGGSKSAGVGKVTGDWDTTGTPPYTNGLVDAKIPEQWLNYPWVYKFGHWRYNWDAPVTRGGHHIVPNDPTPDFDVMKSAIPAQPVYSKLFNAGLREGSNLTTASIEPDLAQSQEHNSDYTTWTFTIPKNVRFQNRPPVNGRQLTAADVVFSFKRHMDTSVNKTVLRNVNNVSAPDDVTVRFDLKQPYLFLPIVLANPNMVIFSPEAFEDQNHMKLNPVGTGAFMLAFHEFQNRTDFVRNPDYWESPRHMPEKYGPQKYPFVDKYTRQYYANQVAKSEAFLNKQVDSIQGCVWETDLYRELLPQAPEALVMTQPGWGCCPVNILFQYKNALFQDKRVRQAFSMAINRTQVWKGGMDEGGYIGASPISFDFLNRDFPRPLTDYGENAQYNPKRAKELMQQAGFNQPVKLQIYHRSPLATKFQGILDTVIFNLREAGVADVTPVARDSQVFTKDSLDHSFPELLFHSSFPQGYSVDTLVFPALQSGSQLNFGNLNDPRLDELIDNWFAASDPEAGVKVTEQIERRITDEVDHLWIGWWAGGELAWPWAHGKVISLHNCFDGIGLGNYKYAWMGEDAPAGRGGKRI